MEADSWASEGVEESGVGRVMVGGERMEEEEVEEEEEEEEELERW